MMPRSGVLPEDAHYPNNGCSLHSDCLTCPFVRCRYEYGGGARTMLAAMMRDEIRAYAAEHPRVAAGIVAARFSVSKRQVYRWLAKGRG